MLLFGGRLVDERPAVPSPFSGKFGVELVANALALLLPAAALFVHDVVLDNEFEC